MDDAEHQQHSSRRREGHLGRHFLLVAYGIQSHVNPGRVLAHRLARLDVDGPVLATLSVPVAAHRRMFPSSDGDGETTDGVISYVPYSDGLDDGAMPKDAEERARSRRASFESLSAIVARLAARGQPVTCIISAMSTPPALDVAREHGIPLAIYWIQPATVLALVYHYFHGYEHLITCHATDPAYQVSLPGLSRPLRIRDFPSFLVDPEGSELHEFVIEACQELFELMDQGGKANFLVNTFDELEATALTAMKQHLDVSAVGPMVGPSTEARIHLFKHDSSYMQWLNARPEKSVVYLSFGSLLTCSKLQVEEILRGLHECGRPYLWVVRNDGRDEEVSRGLEKEAVRGHGMVVEWCDQLEVLAHPSVGCFVTHCGWNSTIEAIASGVPMVAVPNWIDQPTNAYLVEEEWVAGARGERNSDGVLVGTELARCIELVMGEGERAMAIRERAEAFKGMAQEAVAVDGPSEGSLRSFVAAVQASDKAYLKKATQHDAKIKAVK